jgi:hypothetical protein
MLQVTPALFGSYATPAWKGTVPVTAIWAEVGPMFTEMGGGGTTVTVAETDSVVSPTEVAVRVTMGFVGTIAGAA